MFIIKLTDENKKNTVFRRFKNGIYKAKVKHNYKYEPIGFPYEVRVYKAKEDFLDVGFRPNYCYWDPQFDTGFNDESKNIKLHSVPILRRKDV